MTWFQKCTVVPEATKASALCPSDCFCLYFFEKCIYAQLKATELDNDNKGNRQKKNISKWDQLTETKSPEYNQNHLNK